MGASQSTGAAEESVDIKTSYYELLSVERSATQEEYDMTQIFDFLG